MNNLKYCNYCQDCKGHQVVEIYYWETEEALDNKYVLLDFIHSQIPKGWSLVNVYGPALYLGIITYAEVADKNGKHYRVEVIDNSDLYNHKVEIVSIEGNV